MGWSKTVVSVVMAAVMTVAAPAAAQEGTPAPEAAQDPVTIGETEVSWGGAWELDEDATSEEIVTLKIVNEESLDVELATYAEMNDETVEGASGALGVFASAFLTDPGVSSAVEGATGELDDGTVWTVFTFDLDGVAVATVFAVTEREDSTFAISSLTATLPVFAEAVAAAQEQILLDGEPGFLDGIDGAALVPAPVASPQSTPVSQGERPLIPAHH